MRIHEYLVKGASAAIICFRLVKLMGSSGNDQSDYEQKFPEDKQYEELQPMARVTVENIL